MLNEKEISEEIKAYKAHNDQLNISEIADFIKMQIADDNFLLENIEENYYKYLCWIFRAIDYMSLNGKERRSYGEVVLHFLMLQDSALENKMSYEKEQLGGWCNFNFIDEEILKFKQIIQEYYEKEDLTDEFWQKIASQKKRDR